jgi:hypothetical protein
MKSLLILAALAVLGRTAAAETKTGLVRPNAEVRIVAPSFVIVTRADARGVFRVIGLPPGIDYRLEVDGVSGFPWPPAPPERVGLTIDRPWMCTLGGSQRDFSAVLAAAAGTDPHAPPKPRVRAHVETHSTAQVTVIPEPGW